AGGGRPPGQGRGAPRSSPRDNGYTDATAERPLGGDTGREWNGGGGGRGLAAVVAGHARPALGSCKGCRRDGPSADKRMIVEAFHRLGGVRAFARWAEQHPTQFYLLYARLLTREAENTAPAGEVVIEVVEDGAGGVDS